MGQAACARSSGVKCGVITGEAERVDILVVRRILSVVISVECEPGLEPAVTVAPSSIASPHFSLATLLRRYSSPPNILTPPPPRLPLNQSKRQTHRLDFVLRYYPVDKRWLASVGDGIRRQRRVGKVLVQISYPGRYRTSPRRRK